MTAKVGPKVSVYIPAEQMRELEAEAVRLDRSAGWILRKSWSIARAEIQAIPADGAPK